MFTFFQKLSKKIKITSYISYFTEINHFAVTLFSLCFRSWFYFFKCFISHVSILVAPLLLTNATKTDGVFNIFVFLQFHHHPSHDHHRHHQAYDHHHRSHHQLRNLMLIMISKWFQSYFNVIFLGSSKIYSNYVLKAVFSHRKLSKIPLYVGPENWKSYKVLHQKFSRRPPRIGFLGPMT